ncbi:MAG: hypothetical protein CHACPFDD_02368 [Phycisphaerae bacterium]|nr:hypothetical protein [Phycisphaerae bacterium]
MLRGRDVFALLFAVCALAAVASADFITPTNQVRSVDVFAEVVGPESSDTHSDFHEALDFSPYSHTVSVTATIPSVPQDITSDAEASQTSAILGSALTASGSTQGQCGSNVQISSSSNSSSVFSVTFQLLVDADYTLSGNIDSSLTGVGGDGFALIGLEGPGGTIHQIQVSDANDSIFETGNLPAGEYTLIALANNELSASDGAAAAGTGEYNVTLEFTPEPASVLLLAVGALLLRRR